MRAIFCSNWSWSAAATPVAIRQLLDPQKAANISPGKSPKVVVSSCMYDDEAINSHVYNNVGVCRKVVNLHWEQMLVRHAGGRRWFNFERQRQKMRADLLGRTHRRSVCWPMACPAQELPRDRRGDDGFLRPEFQGYFKDKAQLCKGFGSGPRQKAARCTFSSFRLCQHDRPGSGRSFPKWRATDFSGFARTNRVSMEKTLAWFDQLPG